jgi:myosin heavy subunit
MTAAKPDTTDTLLEADACAWCYYCCCCDFLFLLKGGCIRLEGVDDAENFSIVGKAFDTIGMSKELQDQVHAHTI